MGGFAFVDRIDGPVSGQRDVGLPVAVAIAVDQLGDVIHAVDVRPVGREGVQRQERHTVFGAALARFFSLGSQIDREMAVFSEGFHSSASHPDTRIFSEAMSRSRRNLFCDPAVGQSDRSPVRFDAGALAHLFSRSPQLDPGDTQVCSGGVGVSGPNFENEVSQPLIPFVWKRSTPASFTSVGDPGDMLYRLPSIADCVDSDFSTEKEECTNRIERFDDLVGVFRRFHIVVSQISKRIQLIEMMVERVIGKVVGRNECAQVNDSRSRALAAVDSLMLLTSDNGLSEKLFGISIKNELSSSDISDILVQFSSLETNISDLKSTISLIKSIDVADFSQITSSNLDALTQVFGNKNSLKLVDRNVIDIQSHMADLLSHVKQFERQSDRVFPSGHFQSSFLSNLRLIINESGYSLSGDGD